MVFNSPVVESFYFNLLFVISIRKHPKGFGIITTANTVVFKEIFKFPDSQKIFGIDFRKIYIFAFVLVETFEKNSTPAEE